MSKKFFTKIKSGYPFAYSSGLSWQEFCDNMVNNDIVVQNKAASRGLAPEVHSVKFDHIKQEYTLVMDLVEGITLFEYIKSLKSVTESDLDSILNQVDNFHRILYDVIKVRHPDFAARNIMIEQNSKQWLMIDFECFPRRHPIFDQEQSQSDHYSSMLNFFDDLSMKFINDPLTQNLILSKMDNLHF